MSDEPRNAYWSGPALARLVVMLTDESRELTVEPMLEAYRELQAARPDDFMAPPSPAELDGIFGVVETVLLDRMRRTRRRLKVVREALVEAKREAAAEGEFVAGVGKMLDRQHAEKVALYEAPTPTGAIN